MSSPGLCNSPFSSGEQCQQVLRKPLPRLNHKQRPEDDDDDDDDDDS